MKQVRTTAGPSRGDIAAVGLISVAAVFGAGLLAARLSRRAGTRMDHAARDVALDAGTTPVKIVATTLTPPAFPLIYMPAAFIIGRRLLRDGNSAGAAVPRAALLAFVAYHALKRITLRDRPPSNLGESNFSHSYPSGHTTAATAVTLAAVHALHRAAEPPSPGRLVLLAMGVPMAIGASRVALDKHWLTDVVGGWALGTAVAGAAALSVDRQFRSA